MKYINWIFACQLPGGFLPGAAGFAGIVLLEYGPVRKKPKSG
jgi:hypothetical protein